MKKATEKVGKLWTDALMDAADNYNGAEAGEGEVRFSSRTESNEKYLKAPVNQEIIAMVEKVKNGLHKEND